MLRDRNLFAAVWLGVVLALVTLGGDPQAAYHVGILAAVLAVLRWRKDRRDCPALPRSFWRHRFVLLATAAVCGAILAAVQILPAIEWSRQSDRAAYVLPRSVYEVPGYLQREQATAASVRDALLGKAPKNTHHEYTYDFSVGPWRVVEYLWPNFAGRQFPVHRRWLYAIPAEGRVWTPSLYMGLLPFVLAICTFQLRGKNIAARWMSWSVVFGGLAALGWYGIGWLIHEAYYGSTGKLPDGLPIGAPFGGLYWLMTVVLPGYAYFRYPAKLLVVAALGLSMLAALGWDRVVNDHSPGRARKLSVVLAVVSLGGVVVMLAIGPMWESLTRHVPADDLFGPLDPFGSWNDLLFSFAQTASLCLVFCWLLSRTRIKSVSIALLLITAVEMSVAQTWLIQYAPQELWRENSVLETALAAERTTDTFRVHRTSTGNHWPDDWRSTSSQQRQRDGLRLDQSSLAPKFHLNDRVRLVETAGTMSDYNYQQFLASPSSTTDAVAARYIIAPKNVLIPNSRRMPGGNQDTCVWENSNALPRAWIVPMTNVEVLPCLERFDPDSISLRTEEVLARDFRNTAVVESDDLDKTSIVENKPTKCSIVKETPNQLDIDVTLKETSLVVLSDLYFPGWTVTVVNKNTGERLSTPILRTNRVMRGVRLPAGRFQLSYQYRPATFYLGAMISSVACLAVCCVLIRNQTGSSA